MKKILSILVVVLMSINLLAQSGLTLKSEAKMRKSDNPNSDIIIVIPAGKFVRSISHENGYYKVEYNGKIGFINDMYFEIKNISISNSAKSVSANATSNKVWDEYTNKEYWKNNGIDEIEGIYEQVISTYNNSTRIPVYTLALKKTNSGYNIYFISADNMEPGSKWRTGDLKAILSATATKYLFKAKWYMLDKTLMDGYYISLEPGLMKFLDPEGSTDTYLKLYPTANDNMRRPDEEVQATESKPVPSSGTGFAITTDGLIITNNHVVDGAITIKVRGIDNDFNRSYSANVIITDKNNDLAIIKLDDNNFVNLGTIPYMISTNIISVGEDVFVLGYPLRATMGDEIKLTNGIVSSKTGFQGDATSYQISAPVQPGNSGGPLFDSQGNLVGIINAKHSGAENASYAIKSSYLTNLLELLDNPPSLQKANSLKGKSLSEQVRLVKKFIYIIEIN